MGRRGRSPKESPAKTLIPLGLELDGARRGGGNLNAEMGTRQGEKLPGLSPGSGGPPARWGKM